MESPELWFEDFGTAKLKRGRVVVKLDADFAKVIKRGDYKVFLTPEGDCRGLYVRRKSAASFEVRELMGGKSSIAFSYRSMSEITTIGLDLAKHVFQVHGIDAEGTTVLRKPLRRGQVLAFFSRISSCQAGAIHT
jgi:hypothetical protein